LPIFFYVTAVVFLFLAGIDIRWNQVLIFFALHLFTHRLEERPG
jgi:hypothetical protein